MNINTIPLTEADAIQQVDDANTLLAGGDIKYVYCEKTSWIVGFVPEPYTVTFLTLTEAQKAAAIAAANTALLTAQRNNTDFETEFNAIYP